MKDRSIPMAEWDNSRWSKIIPNLNDNIPSLDIHVSFMYYINPGSDKCENEFDDEECGEKLVTISASIHSNPTLFPAYYIR